MKTIEANKAESKDATQDKVEDLNEDTCNVRVSAQLGLELV